MHLILYKKVNTLVVVLLIGGFINLQAWFGDFLRCGCCHSVDTFEIVIDQSVDFLAFNDRVRASIQKKIVAILEVASEVKRQGGWPAVIFDIDGTVFYCNSKTKTERPIIEKPIAAVLAFYNVLQEKNISCIFLTARLEQFAGETKRHLRQVGYRRWENFISMNSFDRILCVPSDDGFALNSVRSWKEEKRRKLSSQYHIIATLDDQSENLKGACVGIPVKIPPYSILLDDESLDAL